jgi:Lsr2
MATKTIVTLCDDLTEEPADTTVSFGFDGRDYEIDLTDANATELRDLFARYIPAARKVGGRTRAATSKPAFSDVDPAAVRAWAAANGMTVSPRGRIKGDVLEAYRAAGN